MPNSKWIISVIAVLGTGAAVLLFNFTFQSCQDKHLQDTIALCRQTIDDFSLLRDSCDSLEGISEDARIYCRNYPITDFAWQLNTHFSGCNGDELTFLDPSFSKYVFYKEVVAEYEQWAKGHNVSPHFSDKIQLQNPDEDILYYRLILNIKKELGTTSPADDEVIASIESHAYDKYFSEALEQSKAKYLTADIFELEAFEKKLTRYNLAIVMLTQVLDYYIEHRQLPLPEMRAKFYDSAFTRTDYRDEKLESLSRLVITETARHFNFSSNYIYFNFFEFNQSIRKILQYWYLNHNEYATKNCYCIDYEMLGDSIRISVDPPIFGEEPAIIAKADIERLIQYFDIFQTKDDADDKDIDALIRMTDGENPFAPFDAALRSFTPSPNLPKLITPHYENIATRARESIRGYFEQPVSEPTLFAIIDSAENHEDKTYKTANPAKSSRALHQLLTYADDQPGVANATPLPPVTYLFRPENDQVAAAKSRMHSGTLIDAVALQAISYQRSMESAYAWAMFLGLPPCPPEIPGTSLNDYVNAIMTDRSSNRYHDTDLWHTVYDMRKVMTPSATLNTCLPEEEFYFYEYIVPDIMRPIVEDAIARLAALPSNPNAPSLLIACPGQTITAAKAIKINDAYTPERLRTRIDHAVAGCAVPPPAPEAPETNNSETTKKP